VSPRLPQEAAQVVWFVRKCWNEHLDGHRLVRLQIILNPPYLTRWIIFSLHACPMGLPMRQQ
jgi:hypothetical protein